MWFNIFKHKEDKEVPSQTLEGRFISDEEFEEMIKPKQKSFLKKEIEEMNEMLKSLKEKIDGNGRE